MLTISLPKETESRLRGEAMRLGVDASAYAARLIEGALPKPAADRTTIDLLERWEQDQATSDPDEIARRQWEFEQFKKAMNQNRLDCEGAESRKVYP